MVVGTGTMEATITDEKVHQILSEGLEQLFPDGKSILVILPDHTRTAPMPLSITTLLSDLESLCWENLV